MHSGQQTETGRKKVAQCARLWILEPVVDGQGGGLSAFARAFLATLGDSHDDFSMGEAFPEIQEMVARNSDQTPVYSYIRNTGDELRDFVFRPTIDEPATR